MTDLRAQNEIDEEYRQADLDRMYPMPERERGH